MGIHADAQRIMQDVSLDSAHRPDSRGKYSVLQYSELARRAARRGLIEGIDQGKRAEAPMSSEGDLRYRVQMPVGVRFPGGSQEFGSDGQPTGYAILTYTQLIETFSGLDTVL
jgi:hypothetical protein